MMVTPPIDSPYRAAIEAVWEDKPQQYGHPADVYRRVAGLWSAFLNIEITPEQAALMMVLLKIGREGTRPGNKDNMVDAHGYLMVHERIQRRREGLE